MVKFDSILLLERRVVSGRMDLKYALNKTYGAPLIHVLFLCRFLNIY